MGLSLEQVRVKQNCPRTSVCPINAVFVLQNKGCQVKLLDAFLGLSTGNFGGSKISREKVHQIVTDCHILKIVIKQAKIPAKTRFVLQNCDPRVKRVKA